MHTDRSAILTLVAQGRITPRDAERLLAAWRDGDEPILRLALYLAFMGVALPHVADVVAAIGQALATLLPVAERVLLLMGRMA